MSNTYDSYGSVCAGTTGMVLRTGTLMHDDANYGTTANTAATSPTAEESAATVAWGTNPRASWCAPKMARATS